MKHIISTIAAASAMLSIFSGCQQEYFSNQNDIYFSSRCLNGPRTKADYSGANYNESGINYERIDWESGDLIRIDCEQASGAQSADYKIKSVRSSSDKYSTASIELSDPNSTGLRWGGDINHIFYAVYPSPAASGVTTALTGATAKAAIPATQPVRETLTDSDDNYTARPSLVKTMLMVATTQWKHSNYKPDEDVLLDFLPVTTAIQFTVTNDIGENLEVSKVALTSASHPLSGAFTYNISTDVCSFDGTVTAADKKATIDLSSSNIDLADGKNLTFTFMLNPQDDLDDLVFSITDKYGVVRSTKLEKADNSKVTFNKSIKTYVKGILIPNGAIWKVSLNPMLDSWNLSENDLLLATPSGVFVTNWTVGIEDDIKLTEYTGYEFTMTDPTQATLTFKNSISESAMVNVPLSSLITSEYSSDMTWGWKIKSYQVGSADAVACNNFLFTAGGLSVTMQDNKLRVQAQKRDAVQKGGHNYWVNSNHRTDNPDWSPKSWTGVTDLSKLNFQNETKTNPINTANTYIVRHAGTYELPLVYGNAIKNGSINTMSYQPGIDDPTLAGTSNISTFLNYKGHAITSAFIEEDIDDELTKLQCAVIWQDECTPASPVVTNLKITKQKTLNIDGDDYLVRYLQFDVPQSNICQNNALIAIYDDANFNYQCDADEVIWSWHIWVTNDPLILGEPISYTNTYGSYNMMRHYALGYIDGAVYPGREPVEITLVQDNSGKELTITVEQPDVEEPGYCSYYQAGRKDPVCRKGGEHDACVSDCTLYIGSYDHYNLTANTTIGMTISNPNIAYRYPNSGTHTAHDNFWGPYRNLWDAACLADESNVIHEHTTVKTIYDPSPAGYKVPTKAAMYTFDCYSGTGTSTPGVSISFPTGNVSEPSIVFMYTGRRTSSGILKEVGTTGYYWTADFSRARSVRFCCVTGNDTDAEGTNGSFLTFGVRPVTE